MVKRNNPEAVKFINEKATLESTMLNHARWNAIITEKCFKRNVNYRGFQR
jgi:hypothetical protein